MSEGISKADVVEFLIVNGKDWSEEAKTRSAFWGRLGALERLKLIEYRWNSTGGLEHRLTKKALKLLEE